MTDQSIHQDDEPDVPTDPSHPAVGFTLQQFPEKLAVVKLPSGAEIPTWAESSSLFSITASATETALVCAGRDVPTKVTARRGLAGFAVMGTIEQEQVGALVELLTPLAQEEIAVHVISTFDTVWLLVPTPAAERAAEAWRRRGHVVNLAIPAQRPRKNKS